MLQVMHQVSLRVLVFIIMKEFRGKIFRVMRAIGRRIAVERTGIGALKHMAAGGYFLHFLPDGTEIHADRNNQNDDEQQRA